MASYKYEVRVGKQTFLTSTLKEAKQAAGSKGKIYKLAKAEKDKSKRTPFTSYLEEYEYEDPFAGQYVRNPGEPKDKWFVHAQFPTGRRLHKYHSGQRQKDKSQPGKLAIVSKTKSGWRAMTIDLNAYDKKGHTGTDTYHKTLGEAKNAAQKRIKSKNPCYGLHFHKDDFDDVKELLHKKRNNPHCEPNPGHGYGGSPIRSRKDADGWTRTKTSFDKSLYTKGDYGGVHWSITQLMGGDRRGPSGHWAVEVSHGPRYDQTLLGVYPTLTAAKASLEKNKNPSWPAPKGSIKPIPAAFEKSPRGLDWSPRKGWVKKNPRKKGMWYAPEILLRGFDGKWTHTGEFITVRPDDSPREIARAIAKESGRKLKDVRLVERALSDDPLVLFGDKKNPSLSTKAKRTTMVKKLLRKLPMDVSTKMYNLTVRRVGKEQFVISGRRLTLVQAADKLQSRVSK